MHFAQLSHHKLSKSADAGSQVVGFVLLAPLLISCTLLLFNLVGVVICQISLTGKVKEGAHYASLWGSDSKSVEQIVADRWQPAGFADCGLDVKVTNPSFGQTRVLKVAAMQCLEIPILQRQIVLKATASEILERDL